MWFRFSDLSDRLQDVARKEFDDVGIVRDNYFYEVVGTPGMIMSRSLNPNAYLDGEESRTMRELMDSLD